VGRRVGNGREKWKRKWKVEVRRKMGNGDVGEKKWQVETEIDCKSGKEKWIVWREVE
jgi:hypothetical protein